MNRTIDQNADEPFERAWLAARSRVRRAIDRILGAQAKRHGQDVLQQTAVAAFRFRHRYEPTGSFASWACRIGANLALNALRREGRTPERQDVADESGLTALDSAPDPAPGALETLLDAQVAPEILAAIGSLPDGMRETFVRDALGDDRTEIAMAQGIPIGTVGSRCFRARALLREALSETRFAA